MPELVPIEKIKQKVDIVNVIQKYLSLKKKSRDNYVALCPFHNDSNPSLQVSQTKQIFKCFSCNTGGDVIEFIRQYKKESFKEALEEVAEIAGIKLAMRPSKTVNEEEQRLFNINRVVMQYGQNVLQTKPGINAAEYLKTRNIAPTMQENFNIGFCSSGRDLANFLKNKGFKLNHLIAAGLFRVVDNKISCFLDQRLVFPIHNALGQVAGFSGRTLNKQTKNKYINTPETLVFHKSQILYNYHRALEAARTHNAIIITEGFLDVISLAHSQVLNVVGTMGTALTSDHVRMILDLTKNIYIFMDSDAAGFRATLNISKKLLAHKITPKIIWNQAFKDPDELIKNDKNFNIDNYLKTALNPLDFIAAYFKAQNPESNPEVMRKLVDTGVEIIVSYPDSAFQELYIKKLHDISSVSVEAITEIINQNKVNLPSAAPGDKVEKGLSATAHTIPYRIQKAEKQILWCALHNRQFTDLINKHTFYFPSLNAKLLMFEINKWYQNNPTAKQISLNENTEYFSDKDNAFIASLQQEYSNLKNLDLTARLKACLNILQKFWKQKDIVELKNLKLQATDVQAKLEASQKISLIKKQNKNQYKI